MPVRENLDSSGQVGSAAIEPARRSAHAGRARRIIFIQYTNPAAYPPLEHASRILADQGWQVLFLGADLGKSDVRAFPPHERIEVRCLPRLGSGVMQKLGYLIYVLWAVGISLRIRPDWIYSSDHLACAPALACRRICGCRVAYHEHDAPAYPNSMPISLRLVSAARRRLARAADLCVLPQVQRRKLFEHEFSREKPTLLVHNCPRREEVSPGRAAASTETRTFTFYYHGSINQERLPLSILDALAMTPPNTRLQIVGYETIGSLGYMKCFMARTAELGLMCRVEYLGAYSRSAIMQIAASADVGIAFMPPASDDINMRYMAGASNKPFDYLAAGLMLLVSDLPDWRRMFVDPGYAIACDTTDVASLAAAMIWCTNNPDLVRAMGEAGRREIVAKWNYETEFAAVVEALCGESRPA